MSTCESWTIKVLSCLAIGIPVSQAWLLHAPETQLEGAACLDFIKRTLCVFWGWLIGDGPKLFKRRMLNTLEFL
eukprot:g24490.t1